MTKLRSSIGLGQDVPHRLQLSDGRNVTAIRTRVEFHLGVETEARPIGFPVGSSAWEIRFEAPEDVNLDFLRPDVLPPR